MPVVKPAVKTLNVASPWAEEYFPHTSPAAGTLLDAADWPQNTTPPLLFTPWKVGRPGHELELKNRIITAPMCMYSATPGTGFPTSWHLVHLGSIAVRGSALVFQEATSVMDNGGLTPEDLGIWSDAHIDHYKPIVNFIKSQGALAGIQLAHGGRKSSTLAPWLDLNTVHVAKNLKRSWAEPGTEGGWEPVWAPSAIPFNEKYPQNVREMTVADIETMKQAWADAAIRADKSGYDVVEVHSAHGYLLHEFLSPLSNKRTDKYGGSLENRMRLPLEIISLVRANLPAHKPLFLRFSATDWHTAGEKNEAGEYISWGLEQSKIYVAEAIKRGVDLLDVSSGGNDPNQKIKVGLGYQVGFADEIRKSLTDANRVPVSSVGLIVSGTQAEEILQSGKSDVIAIARELLRNSDAVFDWAQELNAAVNVPVQYMRSWTRMHTKPKI